MKTEPTKAEFVALIMNIINIEDRLDKHIWHSHLKILDEAIEVLRYYYQYAPKN